MMPIEVDDKSHLHPVLVACQELHRIVQHEYAVPAGMMAVIVVSDGDHVSVSTPSWSLGATVLSRAAVLCSRKAMGETIGVDAKPPGSDDQKS